MPEESEHAESRSSENEGRHHRQDGDLSPVQHVEEHDGQHQEHTPDSGLCLPSDGPAFSDVVSTEMETDRRYRHQQHDECGLTRRESGADLESDRKCRERDEEPTDVYRAE